MSDTTFVDKVTTVLAAWLNDVNMVAYRALASGTAPLGVPPTTFLGVQANLGLLAVTDTGAVNALVLTYPQVPTAYIDGMVLSLKVAVTNTGATTVNVNGLGAKA